MKLVYGQTNTRRYQTTETEFLFTYTKIYYFTRCDVFFLNSSLSLLQICFLPFNLISIIDFKVYKNSDSNIQTWKV